MSDDELLVHLRSLCGLLDDDIADAVVSDVMSHRDNRVHIDDRCRIRSYPLANAIGERARCLDLGTRDKQMHTVVIIDGTWSGRELLDSGPLIDVTFRQYEPTAELIEVYPSIADLPARWTHYFNERVEGTPIERTPGPCPPHVRVT